VTSIGCVRSEPFHCQEDADCVSSIGRGWCELTTSYCSYEDDRCASNRRYSKLAGPLAGVCVAPMEEESSVTVAESTASDETTTEMSSETLATEDSGGPLPTDGRLVWSRLVAHSMGGSDRFLAVALVDNMVVAAGSQRSDLAFVKLELDRGDVIVTRTLNVGATGTDDAVHSLVLGSNGELFACGKADDSVLGKQAWIGTVDAALADQPFTPSVWTDYACNVVTDLDVNRMIAAGDGVPLVPGPPFAWVYAFDRSNPTLGTSTENSGAGSTWNAATHVNGEVLLGGRLGTTEQSGRGVVAGLDADNIPSRIAVVSDALWAVQGLARHVDGFVLGGYETIDGSSAAWVSAHTAAGDERWSWRPGHAESSASRIEDVAVDSQGFTLAVGSRTDGADQQRWIVRLDPQGEEIWSYALPNEIAGGRDIASAVVVLPGDDVVVVGEAEVAPGETDAWIARFSQADA
jgi:hypothetical protein